jgi:hypothetical protein
MSRSIVTVLSGRSLARQIETGRIDLEDGLVTHAGAIEVQLGVADDAGVLEAHARNRDLGQ